MSFYGYVVSKAGTFGTPLRSATSGLTGEEIVIVKWGPLGWVSPVPARDLYQCKSSYEEEARAEAEDWVQMQIEKPYTVTGGDAAGPVYVGNYASFEKALEARNEALKTAKASLTLNVHNLDFCEYDFDGLTDEQREAL